jgi:hypothetical protein
MQGVCHLPEPAIGKDMMWQRGVGGKNAVKKVTGRKVERIAYVDGG